MSFIRWIYLIHSPNNLCLSLSLTKNKLTLLCWCYSYAQICCSVLDLFLCLLTIAISFCAFVVTQWYCPVCIKHHSCTWLGLSLFWFQTFTLHIMLDMFYILFIVDSCNINKISISISISSASLHSPPHCRSASHVIGLPNIKLHKI